ncbi:CLUMA_CG000843, isoform A [Clunio marinus]|uniref:CLUMA_CG000843, isoform A n=1 Tax=Clunio marinus TaxID=568069 RepID=A0A1J1HHP4_9DIPT|nr:CLUMA_CG000843, isoform A [Clunio marinus]
MEFPHLGKHCSKQYCNKLDFLPISCDGCDDIFCSEHYSYIQHDCPNANKKDNQVPICPLCMKPVSCVKGQEDRAVSEHIDSYCKQQTKIYTNSCTFGKCKKRELVPFNCSTCRQNFCLKHRHADVHQCKGKSHAQREMLAQAALRRVQGNQNNNHEVFKSVQGTMSEDEALARAIAASMQDNHQSPITVGDSASSSHDKNKCAIS